jgi:MGT family glycosyltransferase
MFEPKGDCVAKVVVLNLPEHGHMNATYPVVAELVRRGEQVIYYATEPYRSQVEATGARYASYGDAKSFVPPVHKGGLHSGMAWQMELAECLMPRLIEEVQRSAPDYLLIDSMCLWGNLAVQVLDIPTVCMASVFTPNPSHVTVDEMIQTAYGSAPKEMLLAGIDAMNTYIETSRRVDRTLGTVSPDIVEFFSNRQPLNLIFTTREFHINGDIFDNSYQFVGPTFDSRQNDTAMDAGLQQFCEGPLVYVSLGTIFNDRPEFYRACIAAYDGAPYKVLIATGGKVDHAALGAVPGNILLRERIPQIAVLKHASLFLSHGGMNSVNEAMALGVPLVVFPQHGDQHLVAGRVVETGIGLRLAEAVPEAIRELTDTVLRDPRFAVRARAMARQCAFSGGAQAAANSLMEFSARLSDQKASCGA